MAQDWKPIIDELKTKFANREQIRDSVLENLKQTRDTVEKTIKVVATQAKDSRLVHDYVIPFVESEQADQALKFLNDKLGTNPLLSKLEQARKNIIDLKVAQAKTAEEAEVVVEAQAADTEAGEELTETKTTKRKAKTAKTADDR